MKKWLCVILAVAAALSVFFILRHQAPTFQGSRVKNSDCYELDCQSFSGQDEHTLSLPTGERIRVQVQVNKGSLQVTVGMEGHAPIYRSNGMETGTFEVEVPESGDYQMTLTGSGFAGTVSFTAVPME